MVDEAGPVSCRAGLAQPQTNSRGSGIDNAMHALGAAIETFRGTATQLRLLAVTIQASNDCFCNLFDQYFKIAVLRIGHFLQSHRLDSIIFSRRLNGKAASFAKVNYQSTKRAFPCYI